MSSFALKIIAAVSMLIDHMGLIFFPQHEIFRIIGRLAFPIFAYCIAEGYRYTRDRRRYFLRLFVLGLLCQAVYTVVERDIYIGVLLVFSISIVLMSIQEKLISERSSRKIFWGTVYLIAVCAVFALTKWIKVDYGFFGVMLPVVAALFRDKPRRILVFSLCLLALSLDYFFKGSAVQLYSLISVPVLIIYNGKPGKYRLKNFFYVFYPAHLALLYAVNWLLA